MQGIAWEKEYHEIMKKAQVKLSFGSTGNHGDLVMGFVSNLVLLVFYDLFELDLWVLIVSGVRPCHFVCDVVLLREIPLSMHTVHNIENNHSQHSQGI